ncbi:pentapeptide repeat-containing protein [Umezawaea tangerina]|uniref:Pentapeptide repeat protein n=1 Tax=Umezawaea tangerina TaxID=84725 RepID=A0A2T0TAE8_9PSEU|nr:pentapeptide repeat-containing protein [Umezawaea tangerina]PRY42618.1 pentapeptide repeat protein [Umezawaea tangerina]
MPYAVPNEASTDSERETRSQERQVRLTAQRIIADHLRPRTDADTFWSDIDLDLSGAALIDLDLSGAHCRTVTFTGATFTGITRFVKADFSGTASFDETDFRGAALFDQGTFGVITFLHARTTAPLYFEDAEFKAGAPDIPGRQAIVTNDHGRVVDASDQP